MTQIGDIPGESNAAQYHKAIDASSLKFLNALESYKQDTLSSEEKSHLKLIMDQQMDIIRAAVKEIRTAGIYKQEVKVEKDYQNFMSKGDSESYAALEHDLTTLRDYNQLN
jgi:hypothetical protein